MSSLPAPAPSISRFLVPFSVRNCPLFVLCVLFPPLPPSTSRLSCPCVSSAWFAYLFSSRPCPRLLVFLVFAPVNSNPKYEVLNVPFRHRPQQLSRPHSGVGVAESGIQQLLARCRPLSEDSAAAGTHCALRHRRDDARHLTNQMTLISTDFDHSCSPQRAGVVRDRPRPSRGNGNFFIVFHKIAEDRIPSVAPAAG